MFANDMFDKGKNNRFSSPRRRICGSDRTTVIVAHRLSTIRAADKIIVIDAGKVVQEGNHRDLYRNKSGLYYNLAESQKLHKNSFAGDQDIPDDASAGQGGLNINPSLQYLIAAALSIILKLLFEYF